MANIKISELNELEQVDNDDLLVIVDTSANETKKISVGNLTPSNDKLVHVGTSIDSNYKTNILHSKNLLPTNINTHTENGITITNNGNGTITLNGTCTSGFGIYMDVGLRLKAGTYTNSVNSIKNGVYLSLDNINNTMIVPPATSKTFTIANDTSYARYLIWIDTNVSFNNEVIKMQLEKGSTATTFEEYITPTINVYGEDIYVKGQNDFYSTQEQVIGTWIDGKPLYRRVLESGYLTGEYTLLGNSYNLDIVMIYGWILKPSTGYILPYGTFMNTASSYTCRVFFDGTNVKVQQGTNYLDGTFKARVVIEYTKKSDTAQNTRSISNDEEVVEEDNR